MKSYTRHERPLIFLFFIIISLFIFNDVIFKGRYFADNIKADIFYVRSHIPASFLKSLSFLWNPCFFCGFPLFADIDYYNFLSPLTLLRLYLPCFMPLSNVAAGNLVYIFYFSIAGFFMYLYARSINMTTIGAITAGILFGMIRHYEPNIPNTYIWFPLVLIFLNRAITKTIGWDYVIFTGLFMGIQLFGGGIQYSYYFSIMFIFYFIFKSLLIFRGGGLNFDNRGQIKNLLFALLLIFLISLGIFAIQFLPTLELSKHSARYYLKDYRLLYSADYLSRDYFKAMVFFNTDMPGVFIGLIGVFLAFLPLFYRNKSQFYYFYLFVAVFFLIMSSHNLLTNYLYYHLPLYSVFKKPIRAGYIFIFSISLLAGLGIEKIRFKLLRIILLISVILSVYSSWQKSYMEKLVSSSDDKISLSISSLLDNLKGRGHYRIFLNPEYTYFIKDNSYFSSGQSNLIFSRYLEFTKTGLNIDKLREDAYYNFLLYPNYLRVSSTKYVILSREEENEENKKILNQVARYYDNSFLFEKIYEDKIIKGYRFKEPLDKVLFIREAVYIEDRKEILDNLKSETFSSKQAVILEEKVKELSFKEETDSLVSEVQILSYQQSKVKVHLKINSGGFLVLSDTYYPGWKAYIDNRPVKIYRANYLFRAVYIEKPGDYTIEFIYSPFSFRLGAVISVITLICCVWGIVWIRIKKSHQTGKK